MIKVRIGNGDYMSLEEKWIIAKSYVNMYLFMTLFLKLTKSYLIYHILIECCFQDKY